jgi:integrase
MSVRKRTWTTKGETREAWIVDYTDAGGTRRLKTFKRKRDADTFAASTRIELGKGTHVADRATVTVAEAAAAWMERGENAGLERSTLAAYRSHVELHIGPFIGRTKLNRLTVPGVQAFAQQLRDNDRSPALVRKVLASLTGIVDDAIGEGIATHNPVRDSAPHRRSKRHGKATARDVKRLEVGVDIPSPAEVRAILTAAAGWLRPFLMVAAMTGLRASELRGLAWVDVDLVKGILTVRQRADRWGVMGEPKSAAGRRTIPLPPSVVTALKEWKLACPLYRERKDGPGKLWLVFPNSVGKTFELSHITARHYWPLLIAAGVAVPRAPPELDGDGKPAMAAKYPGLHCLRHFFCSWCAAPVKDGGLGLPLKTVQVRMGHSKLAITADRYGHLFPSTDDAELLAAGEKALLGS